MIVRYLYYLALYLAILTINLMNITSAPIPNPITVPIRIMVTTIGKTSATVALGMTLKSKGNRFSKVKTAAIPRQFKTIITISRRRYLSKTIKMLCPIIDEINAVFRIGNHKLKSAVRSEALVPS